MSHCPSHDWDRYCDLYPDLPEDCPHCGLSNTNENGDWYCEEHKPFCSEECAKKYVPDEVVPDEVK